MHIHICIYMWFVEKVKDSNSFYKNSHKNYKFDQACVDYKTNP
jgi:hypothetical protein